MHKKSNATQMICIQYYNSPCGELVLASIGNELCLCDWNRFPAAGLEGIAQHPIRRDKELYGDSHQGRQRKGSEGSGSGHRRQWHLHHHSLPSCSWQQPFTYWLYGRIGQEEVSDRNGEKMTKVPSSLDEGIFMGK